MLCVSMEDEDGLDLCCVSQWRMRRVRFVLCVSMEDEDGLDLCCVSQWRMRRVSVYSFIVFTFGCYGDVM